MLAFKPIYSFAEASAHIEALRRQFGHKKRLPPDVELAALVALSHYPELTQTPIAFVLKDMLLPYAARPALNSLLNPFAEKNYVVLISRRSTPLREPTLLHNLAFNAQVGALGHELAHIQHYECISRWAIIGEGLRYLNPGFRERYEKATDCIAIAHGLGPQLLAWSRATYPTKLQDGQRWKTYYAPEEIEQLLAKGHTGMS